jgi:hypothetical protein
MDPESIRYAMNLSDQYRVFQDMLKEELTRRLIDQAVEEFKAKIAIEIMARVDEISVTAMNSYYEPLRQQPIVNIQFTL